MSDKRLIENVSQYKRVNRGYKLREDLIKDCKRIALEEDRNLYEVMEEALEHYLKQHPLNTRARTTNQEAI